MTADKTPRTKSAVERLLDGRIFAPVGEVLRRDKRLAELAEAGRKQLRLTRSLGQAALHGLVKGAQASRSPGAALTSSVEDKAPPYLADEFNSANPSGTVPDIAGLAVPHYGSLTAREVIAIVRECGPDRAAWIRTQETDGKNRVTILRAIDARHL